MDNSDVDVDVELEPEAPRKSYKQLFCNLLKSECHYTALCLCYKDNKPFAFSPVRH